MENVPEKMEKSTPPSVAIDGTKIKNIREAKKLTQLYVASVVGVTTDTISRWENNRYPTIRRDNAEKLATALEVGLAEILRQEEPPEERPEPLPPPEKQPAKGRRHLLLLLTLAVLVILAGVFLLRQTGAPPIAERWLPRFGAPGEIIPVQIKVKRKETGSRGFIIKEQLPAGWRLVNASPPAVVGQEGDREVKWLIPGGTGTVNISYTVRVASAAELKSQPSFAGTIVVHEGGISRTDTIGGTRLMTVAGVHWADDNGDGRIDDNEIMPAYYVTEEMKGLGLDWKEIEAIWSGKGYRWDREKQVFVVIK
jgi:transcriptional regulator with XRE-family HTH domain